MTYSDSISSNDTVTITKGCKNLAFLYDEMGDVGRQQDNNLGLTENAYYDNDYRLTSTTLNGTQNLSVTYDDTMGNITSRSDVAAGAAWTYSSTQKHAVTEAGSSSYQYSFSSVQGHFRLPRASYRESYC